MESEVKPLFPDDMTHRKECWNCGRPGIVYVTTRYKCVCGCGWTNRFGVNPEIEKKTREFREKTMERQLKYPLVDFTKPGALSSPA